MSKTVLVVALESELPPVDRLDIRYSGVGKVNAAYTTMKAIGDGATRIINFGTAGLVSNKDLVGKLAHIDVILQRDMIAEPQAPRGVTPFDTDERTSGAIMLDTNTNITLGTGDSFVQETDEWFNYSNIDLVDMEAFAIAKVCISEGVKFECLKWVSDFADENAAESWEQNQSDGKDAMMRWLE